MRMLGCIGAMVIALSATHALAAKPKDPRAQAKEHFERGTDLYRKANYREAVAEFEAAYNASPHSAILFNLAQCHEKLGNLPEALHYYRLYLESVKARDERASIQAEIANLESRLAASQPQVVVHSEPPGATVTIDRRVAGTTPLTHKLDAGRHTVAVEAAGYHPKSRDIEIARGASMTLDFALEKVVVAGVETEPADAMKPIVPDAPAAGVTAEPPRPRLWTWVAVGVSGVALITGAALGSSAKSANDELHAREHDRAKATELSNTAVRNAANANILFGVAGGAGAAAIALFFIEGSF